MPHRTSFATRVVRSRDGTSKKCVISEKNDEAAATEVDTSFASAPTTVDAADVTFETANCLVPVTVEAPDLTIDAVRLATAVTGAEAATVAKKSVPPVRIEARAADEARRIFWHCLTAAAEDVRAALLAADTERPAVAADDCEVATNRLAIAVLEAATAEAAADRATETERRSVAVAAVEAVTTNWTEPADCTVPLIDDAVLRIAATALPTNADVAEEAEATRWNDLEMAADTDELADVDLAGVPTFAAATAEATDLIREACELLVAVVAEDAALTVCADDVLAAEVAEEAVLVEVASDAFAAAAAELADLTIWASAVLVAAVADAAETVNRLTFTLATAAEVDDDAALTSWANLARAPDNGLLADIAVAAAAVFAEATVLVALRTPPTAEDRAAELPTVALTVAVFATELGMRSSSNQPCSMSDALLAMSEPPLYVHLRVELALGSDRRV